MSPNYFILPPLLIWKNILSWITYLSSISTEQHPFLLTSWGNGGGDLSPIKSELTLWGFLSFHFFRKCAQSPYSLLSPWTLPFIWFFLMTFKTPPVLQSVSVMPMNLAFSLVIFTCRYCSLLLHGQMIERALSSQEPHLIYHLLPLVHQSDALKTHFPTHICICIHTHAHFVFFYICRLLSAHVLLVLYAAFDTVHSITYTKTSRIDQVLASVLKKLQMITVLPHPPPRLPVSGATSGHSIYNR